MSTDLQKVFSQTKEYETIAEKHEILYPKIEKALAQVREFIVEKKLIIYGGMSIDLSLKLAGDPGIYSDSVIPDYDFMSPNAYNDSNELAQILNKKGFPMVSAINAYHPTTRRVRVQFRNVADITYIPQSIYDNLPYLTFKDLKIIHPMFQRIDMHHAFSYPLANPPMEVVYGRLSKDITRFRLLDARYPLRPDTKMLTTLKREFSESVFSTLRFHMPVNVVLGGLSAYAFIYDLMNCLLLGPELKAILDDAGTSQALNQEFKKLVPARVEFMEKQQFMIQLPKSVNPILTLISDAPMEIFPSVGSTFYSPSGLKHKKEPEVKVIAESFFNRYLDLKPKTRTVIIQQTETTQIMAEILDNKGSLLPIFNFSSIIKELQKYNSSAWKLYKIPSESSQDWQISNVYNILMLFLLEYFRNQKSANIYLNLYWSTMRLVWIAEQIVIALKNKDQKAALEFQTQMPYFFTASVYGKYNWDMTYIAQQKEKMGEHLLPPKGYFPDQYPQAPQFDMSKTWIFQTDGEKTTTFETIEL